MRQRLHTVFRLVLYFYTHHTLLGVTRFYAMSRPSLSVLNLLRDWARADLTSLPPTLLLSSTPNNLTIFDKYAKATFHFLVMPRLPNPDLSTNELDSLQSLLSNANNRRAAKSLLEGLKQDGEIVKATIEQEMLSRFGYKWDIWIGFHAVPSMQ